MDLSRSTGPLPGNQELPTLAGGALSAGSAVVQTRIRTRLQSALKAFSQAEDAKQEVNAMRRLRSAIRAYEKLKTTGEAREIPNKLLAYAFIDFGTYLVERRRQWELAKEILVQGLAHCGRERAYTGIRLRGVTSLALYYTAKGNLQQAQDLCVGSLEQWDRTTYRHAALGKLLQSYGDVLSELGNFDLAWRQFEAAREFFGLYRKQVPSRYSELLYVDSLKRWGKFMLTVPGQTLDRCLDLIREISAQSDILLGDDYRTTLTSRIELIHARILAGDYSGAEQECFQTGALLRSVQECKAFEEPGSNREQQALLREEIQLIATQCELTTLLAVTQFFQGNERTAMELMRDACRLAFSINDDTGSNIKCVFLSLGTIWQHRQKRPQSRSLNKLMRKTAKVVLSLKAEEEPDN